MPQFVNILSRLEHRSDILWASRYIDFCKTFLPSDQHPLSHKELKKSILDSEIVKAVEELELETNQTDKKITQTRIRAILDEVGYSRSIATIRWLAYLTVKILRKTLNGIYVNETHLQELKETMGNTPVVLVPTHRSYGDFILMAFICFFYEIEIPCVAAGLDFLSMWIMGEILRKTKAFFIRRTFHDDKLYKTIFTQYVSSLLTHGNSPIEFFIEGTRSRTGKSLAPKYGFLSMILKPFLDGKVPDIKLVPVSISYDRFLEEWLFTRELLGTPKPKESTKGLLKVFSILDENYGNVYFNFGQPISVRDWISREHDQRIPRPFIHDVKLLAFHLIESHTKLQVLGASHLVMVSLYSNLITHNSTELSLELVKRKLGMLLYVMHALGVNVLLTKGELDEEIAFACSVHPSLIRIMGNKLYFYGKEDLAEHSKTVSVNRGILLLLYVNPVATELFCPALMLMLISAADGIDGHGGLADSYSFLCELFEYEFPITSCNSEKSFRSCLEFLSYTKCIVSYGQENKFELSINCEVISLFYSIIQPYLLGYTLLCRHVLQVSRSETVRSLSSDCERHLQELYDSGTLDFPFCLTKSFSSNCVAALSKMQCFCRERRVDEPEFLIAIPEKIQRIHTFLDVLNVNPVKKSPVRTRL